VIVYAGTDPLTGRRLRFRQTVKTEEQAQILLGKLLEQVAEGRQPDTGVTVAELLRQYLTVAELDRSTRQTYEGYIRRTILPALGSMELRKVRGPVLDMLYARLHRCGDLACSGKPFTEHFAFPAIEVTPTAARRPASVGPGGYSHPRGDRRGPAPSREAAAIGQSSG
jgi:hypothetical protein